MKARFGITIVIVLFALLAGSRGLPAQAGPSVQDSVPQMSTPGLIEASRAKGELDQDTANLYMAYALTNYEKLPARFRSNVPWDGTLPLLHLREKVQVMKAGVIRTEIVDAISAICSASSGSLPNNTSSTHFYVEYNTIGGGLSLITYTTSLESAWTKEITTFGWAAPPVLTSNPPPGNLYHVRIDTLSAGLYGYVSTSGAYAGLVGNNPNTAWNDLDAYATCMVLNRDYSGFPGTPQTALDATTGHEFNHSIQFGIGALTGANAAEDAFTEGGASWMEDEVFDSANDNYNYLWPTFSMCMGEYADSPYPYWITWRGLTERYGTGVASGGEQVMQDFWEETSKGTGDNLSAMNTALVNKGTTLANAYHAYAIAVKFNKTCGGSYVYPYCFEEATGYLGAAGSTSVDGTIASVGGSYNGNVPDNYALNWISLPTSGGPYNVTLQNTSAGGQLRGSVVCDTGSALSVTPLPSVVGAGTSTTLANFNPSGCTSVVAVITNQSQTANNPSSCTSRSYQLKAEIGGGGAYSTYLPIVLKPLVLWTTLVSEDFEGAFPGVWTVSDAWSGYGTYYWGKRTCRPYAGSYSGWGVGGGANGAALGCGSAYPTRADSLMVYGPFSLADATAGDLSFKLWLNTESGYDFVCRSASIDGANFYGTCTSGNTAGWIDRVLDLSNVYTLGNLMGQPNVWIMLEFYSDSSTTYAEGGYVDNIILRKCTSASCTTNKITPDSGASQVIEFPVAKVRGR